MRIPSTLLVAAALVVAGAPFAWGATYIPDPPVTASPALSPFDPCATQPDSESQPNFENTEVEPLVAVNPTNQSNVIGVFQEDRWVDGGAHGLMAGVSQNGGASYGPHWARFSSCSGNPAEEFPRATDPWITFDAAGRAYQVGLPIVDGGLTKGSAVTTSYSDDGGLSWTTPVDVAREHSGGLNFFDKESITADPYHAGRAWTTWIQGNLPGENISFNKLAHAFSYRGTPMVSRTTDGGNHWSTPQAMTNANEYAQGNQIVVEPDGTLVDVQAVLFKGSGIQPTGNGTYIAVMRSNDAGKTWSRPSKVSPLRLVGEQADGKPLRVGDYLPDIEVDPANGNLYVTWADSLGGSTNKIVFSRSTDEGGHWSAPVVVSHNDAAQSFNHAVAVANDGDVAVLYYDTARNDSSPGIPTDVYLRHSGNGGGTWSAPLLVTQFDLATAPVARGLFVGDYMGLEAIGASGLVGFLGVTDGTPNSANVLSVRFNR